MDRFHIITLSVASVALILILTVTGILLLNDKRSQKFPTAHAKCPDGWTHTPGTVSDPDDKCNFTAGGENYGLLNPDVGHTQPIYDDICSNKAWADQNGIYWDGVTTYNSC
jgi:hypothetical protein